MVSKWLSGPPIKCLVPAYTVLPLPRNNEYLPPLKAAV